MPALLLALTLVAAPQLETDAPILSAPPVLLAPAAPPMRSSAAKAPRELTPALAHRRLVKKTLFIGGGLFVGSYVLGFAPLGYGSSVALGGPGSPPADVGNTPLIDAAVPVAGPALIISEIARKPLALQYPSMDVLVVAIAVVDCLAQIVGLALTGYGIFLAAE